MAALIPWNRVPWLQRLCYAMPTSALRNVRVAPLERGVLVRASDVLEGFPFGTLFEQAAPDVLVPVGMRVVPAVSPALRGLIQPGAPDPSSRAQPTFLLRNPCSFEPAKASRL